ncbi:hypothetical protein FQR65_LT02692 [Abscondita terminalis]|nr:hypothetical protein FQR65_LT02692 [Abscondita terminalis]
MTSQISPDQRKPYCKDFIDRNKEYTVQLPKLERTAWMWIIIFTYFVPEIMTFLRSLRICLFKNWKSPQLSEMLSIMLMESLAAIGNALLVFCILPDLDVVKGVMLTNAVCFVPSVVGFLSRSGPKENDNMLNLALDILSMLAQATSLVVWPMIENKPSLWLIPISLLFISCGWWENYVSEQSPIDFLNVLGKKKKTFQNSRYFIFLWVSVLKCLVFFITTVVIIYVKEESASFLFTDFMKSFKPHSINITEVRPILGSQIDFGETFQQIGEKTIPTDHLTPVWVFLINITSTYICYIFGKFSCKIRIQEFSYAFPINLTVPTTISLLIAICGVHNGNPCVFDPSIPHYLFFNNPPMYFLKDFIASQHVWVWVLWLLSQTWITIHLWYPKCENLAKTEKLYVKPMYDAFLIDQSIALNRRRDNTIDKEKKRGSDSSKTKVYACACMWHETEQEMMAFLKSILRLDRDLNIRRKLNEKKQQEKTYELETHIFFDDAFIRTHTDDNNPQVNVYVEAFVEKVDKAAMEVVGNNNLRVKPPEKYVTPYGGRLQWQLPGDTIMIVHLKDKKKIRSKKRWSQVMYMYYLFGFRIMALPDTEPEDKIAMSENTYILALDGDIDFQPKALDMLIQLMEKNKQLGAACGRIHPLGFGPLVWYQMFEYAIGHWLQKSTEHVIGCVLCSPGCFSLFRAEALMEDRVMKKYATKSVEALDFVQFDQGEDRWLCTLLLQMGYRVEYSAASDAYTHCPESFNDFYNQRRRWMSSTTANILDLLNNYKSTVKNNQDISLLYIIYQVVLMIGSVLGPGTIFLMLVGAFVAAFQLDQWSSFLWNIIPILFYLIVCSLFNSKVQLFIAGILSALYGLVMMAVLVGVMLQITQDGVLAPSSLFFFCIAGEFILTALMHPKEFSCLLYGIVYYVTVPSMYMLLVIYTVFNLNDISWGTRDVTVQPPPKKKDDKNNKDNKEDDSKNEESKKKHRVLSMFGNDNGNSGSFEFSVAGLFKCFLCTHKVEDSDNKQLSEIMINLKQLTAKVQSLEHSVTNEKSDSADVIVLDGASAEKLPLNTNKDEKVLTSDEMDDRDHWTENPKLGEGGATSLRPKEKKFWEELIQAYLFVYEDDAKTVRTKLKDLRDTSVLGFFMINAIFVLVVFLLTLKKDLLHADWPLDVKYNFTYHPSSGDIELDERPLELEPIGFVFLIFFFSLLVVQFIGMLFHRLSTLSQILCTTKIREKQVKKTEKEEEEDMTFEDYKVMLSSRDDESDDEEEQDRNENKRRKTVRYLVESKPEEQKRANYNQAVEQQNILILAGNPIMQMVEKVMHIQMEHSIRARSESRIRV